MNRDIEHELAEERARRQRRVDETKEWRQHDHGGLMRQQQHLAALMSLLSFDLAAPFIRRLHRVNGYLQRR